MRGRYTNLSKMSLVERGSTLKQFRSEYLVYGDFVRQEPYTFATSRPTGCRSPS